MNLLNPNVLVGLIIAFLAVFTSGVQYEKIQQQKEIARLSLKMQKEATELHDKHEQEKIDAKKTIDRLRADVSSGTIRLSIPSSSCNSASGDSEARAELDRQTSQDLISITEDGDQAIRDLNYCIDRYNSIKDTK